MPLSLKELAPLRVIIGSEDVTSYLDDGWTFSNVDPGGYEACSLPFPKDMPQTIRGLPIRIDSGLHVAWEGRVQQIQRSLGNRTTIMGQGYGSLFQDAAGSMVFVDRDLTRWQDPSYAEQLALVAGNFQLASAQVGADPNNNNPALVQAIQDSWTTPWEPIVESWYDSGPENLITEIYYDVIFDASLGSNTNFAAKVFLSSDAQASTTEGSANLYQTPFGEQKGYFSPATQYRFGLLRFLYGATNAGAQGAQYGTYWHNMAVYGNHGLTGVGSDPVGFYPSQIVGWTIGQVPGLQAGTVQTTDASGYIVPHSVYYTPVTLDTVIGDMATIQGWHWGVWESLAPLTGNATPRVDFRPRPAPGAFTAFCRRRDCDTLDIREDISQQYNVAVVNYTDVAGNQQAVTVTLDNPVLDQAGIPSRTVVFSGGTMTAATATIFGLEALVLTNTQARVAGTADLVSPVDMGGPAPAWLLKAGIDRLRVADVPSIDAWGSMSDFPITRVEASISSSGFTTSVELGSGANLVETLQARLTAATALAGQGGV